MIELIGTIILFYLIPLCLGGLLIAFGIASLIYLVVTFLGLFFGGDNSIN